MTETNEEKMLKKDEKKRKKQEKKMKKEEKKRKKQEQRKMKKEQKKKKKEEKNKKKPKKCLNIRSLSCHNKAQHSTVVLSSAVGENTINRSTLVA